MYYGEWLEDSYLKLCMFSDGFCILGMFVILVKEMCFVVFFGVIGMVFLVLVGILVVFLLVIYFEIGFVFCFLIVFLFMGLVIMVFIFVVCGLILDSFVCVCIEVKCVVFLSYFV